MDNGEIKTNKKEGLRGELCMHESFEFVRTSIESECDQDDIDLKTSVIQESNSEDSPGVTKEPSQYATSQDMLSQCFEFVMDDSLPADAFHSPNGGKLDNSGQNSLDLSFLAGKDSVSISDSHFVSFDEDANNPTSSFYSQNRQVACDDSMSNQCTSTSFFDSKTHLEQEELPTAEDSSLDSGLGSVDSVYGHSGEENASSPEASIPPSSLEATLNSSKNVKGQERFYDCAEEVETKVGVKRHLMDADEGTEAKRSKKQNRVQFRDVTVFYFPRRQSFITVPSQGGSTLGMAFKHVHSQTMTLHEHFLEMRQKHIQQVKEHIREQKVENKVKQLKFLHPDAENTALTSMAISEIELSGECDARNEDDSILDNVDDFFFLQPISTKKRRNILRNAGVTRIDSEEKLMNRITRQSREMCGCSCDGICLPESCECALAGIQCQVDREAFPCSCVPNGCKNENGRIEFDSDRVRCHFEATMEKLRENDNELQHIIFSDDQSKETESVSSVDSEYENLSLEDEGTAGRPDLHFSQVQDGQSAYQDFVQGGCTWYDPGHEINGNLDIHGTEEIVENSSEEIDPEFLQSLGLQKIEKNVFSYSETGQKDGVSPANPPNNPDSPSSNIFTSTTQALMSTAPTGEFPQSFYTPHSATCHPYYQSTPKNSYGCFDNHCTTSNSPHGPSMFGTTSSKRDIVGNALTRDCAVLLDPIATFMSTHNPLPDPLTHL